LKITPKPPTPAILKASAIAAIWEYLQVAEDEWLARELRRIWRYLTKSLKNEKQ
jgi:hypothetical protein